MKPLVYIVRVALVVLLLAIGVIGFEKLSHFKQEPDKRELPEVVISARAMKAQPRDIQAIISGYGTVSAQQRAMIAAEVTGRVIEVHPRLEEGNVIKEGELLLQINPADYEAAVAQADASLKTANAQLAELKSSLENDQRRLEVIKRSRDLAEKQFNRMQKLALEENVESEVRMEAAETEFVQRQEAVVTLENRIKLYPSQINAAEARVLSAEAALQSAKLNLKKTSIEAPFTGRIQSKMVDRGQTVPQMSELITLVNDETLEIKLPVEGREVAKWLDLESAEALNHWFGDLPEIEVSVRWTEQPEMVRWAGKLDRVQEYDSRNRTIMLVVQVTRSTSPIGMGEDPVTGRNQEFPLLEGMFCQVDIPGRTLHGVYQLPREAVAHDGTIYTATKGVLETRKVEVLRLEENRAIVGAGLEPGDIVLVSKPGLIRDGTRVEVEMIEGGSIEDAAGNDRGTIASNTPNPADDEPEEVQP